MTKKVIRLTESQLIEIARDVVQEVIEESQLLMEMPYERNDFLYMVDKDARNAYTHLAKLILYKNSTNDANKWINEVVNNFTIPMLTAKVYVSKKARSKVLWNGYVVNLFGKQFEDYDYQMKNFCLAAIKDVEEKAKKEGITSPQHDDINQSMSLGKNIVVAYANAIATLTNGVEQEEANKTLQNTIRDEFKKSFNLDV